MFFRTHRIVTAALSFGLFAPGQASSQAPRERLAEHTTEFRREIIEVTDGVHVAVGYALANSILIEGEDGVIIVDVLGSMQAAEEVAAAFRAVSDQPVSAVVYTHSHPDHVLGTPAFTQGRDADVYAHDSFRMMVGALHAPALIARAPYQFGTSLSEEEFLNAGIGPRMSVVGFDGYVPPTRHFADRLELEIAGVRVVLQHAPGETDDQLYVWLPDQKVLMPGDNFYKSFPNLYAIRGTSYRNVRMWAESLDRMLQEGEIEHLVPSHTRPISGVSEVTDALTNYRDAIRFVFEATVEGLNAGVSSDDLANQITLPERLRDQPYLQEFYGTVPWSVRAIYHGLLGWFDGNATNLFPLPDRERAVRMVSLLGGVDRLRAAAGEALIAEDYQWAAELTDYLLAVDEADGMARQIKADALSALADLQTSANARNWYLTQAKALRAPPIPGR